MSTVNFIDKLPFHINLNPNETKEFYFRENIKNLIIPLESKDNIKVLIKLDNSYGERLEINYDSNNKKEDISINRKRYNRFTITNIGNSKELFILKELT